MADQADNGNQGNDPAATSDSHTTSTQDGGDQDSGNGVAPADLTITADPKEDADVVVTERIRDEVKDALELADFVVKTGARKTGGRSVPPELIKVIKVTAGNVKLFDPPKDPITIKASLWARFELAYYALVEFSSPVTVETLRNTHETGRGGFFDVSPAQKFTRLLWIITIAFALAVIAAASIAVGADMPGRKTSWWIDFSARLAPYIKIIIPYAYGGLGACAFLLRTAHSHIAERSFDVRRKPEYLNRILLGTVSGGAIVLLFAPDSDDDTVKISAAALGFIAGYSNDFLFNAIERVVAAVLPRVGLETLKKEAAAPAPAPLELPTAGMTLKDLMERMENAKPEDKELYKSLLIKLRDRL
jgi:hypothetical protein